MPFEPLPQDVYQQSALTVARELLGQMLVRRLPDGSLLTGRIVETEAYTPDDPSCHAFRGETPRSRSMFRAGGIAYVYLIYGMYYCFNAVAHPEGEGAAVLIRAVEPLEGIATMQIHRKNVAIRDLARGPGRLCRAFHIDRGLDGIALDQLDSPLFISQAPSIPDSNVLQTPRIGISAPEAAILAPWRFIIADSGAISGQRRQNLGQPYNPSPNWFSQFPLA